MSRRVSLPEDVEPIRLSGTPERMIVFDPDESIARTVQRIDPMPVVAGHDGLATLLRLATRLPIFARDIGVLLDTRDSRWDWLPELRLPLAPGDTAVRDRAGRLKRVVRIDHSVDGPTDPRESRSVRDRSPAGTPDPASDPSITTGIEWDEPESPPRASASAPQPDAATDRVDAPGQADVDRTTPPGKPTEAGPIRLPGGNQDVPSPAIVGDRSVAVSVLMPGAKSDSPRSASGATETFAFRHREREIQPQESPTKAVESPDPNRRFASRARGEPDVEPKAPTEPDRRGPADSVTISIERIVEWGRSLIGPETTPESADPVADEDGTERDAAPAVPGEMDQESVHRSPLDSPTALPDLVVQRMIRGGPTVTADGTNRDRPDTLRPNEPLSDHHRPVPTPRDPQVATFPRLIVSERLGLRPEPTSRSAARASDALSYHAAEGSESGQPDSPADLDRVLGVSPSAPPVRSPRQGEFPRLVVPGVQAISEGPGRDHRLGADVRSVPPDGPSPVLRADSGTPSWAPDSSAIQEAPIRSDTSREPENVIREWSLRAPRIAHLSPVSTRESMESAAVGTLIDRRLSLGQPEQFDRPSPGVESTRTSEPQSVDRSDHPPLVHPQHPRPEPVSRDERRTAPQRERRRRRDQPPPSEPDARTETRSNRVHRPSQVPTKPTRTDPERSHRERPPEGRETRSLYPDMTAKTLAPRVDVTYRDDPAPSRPHAPPDRSVDEINLDTIGDLLAENGPRAEPSATDVDRVVARLHRALDRKRRVERERRGL